MQRFCHADAEPIKCHAVVAGQQDNNTLQQVLLVLSVQDVGS